MKWALPILLLPAIASCSLSPATDMRLVAVTRVPARSVPAGAAIGRDAQVWKVSLEGSVDWARSIRRHEMNGYPIVLRCDDRNASLFATGPYVGAVLIAYGSDPRFDTFDPASKSGIRYDIYVAETGRYRSEADFNAPMPSYDLGKQRIELCITLGGGAMTGLTARSNEVRAAVGEASAIP